MCVLNVLNNLTIKSFQEEYKPIKVAIEVMRTQKEFWDFYCEDALSAHLSRPLGKFSRQHLKQCLLQLDSS